ncbi:MAG TPA: hypothetical protein V6C90_14155 [Coleofasciculaceae cyanobacterium]
MLRHSQNWHLDSPPSDLERQKLAQRQLKPNSQAWEEGELVEIRLAEDLKRKWRERRSPK